MSTVSDDDVRRLAKFSALELADDEIEPIRKDINQTLTMFDALSQLNTTGVEPTYQVNGPENVWREDVVVDGGVERQQLIDLAANKTADSIKVPKVL